MKFERAILISFLGNYLINNVVAGVVALIPAGDSTGYFTAQYIGYVVLAAIAVGLFTWWYLKTFPRMNALKTATIFGAIAFAVALVTAFVTGITGVLTQTGSISQMFTIIPNFWPFLWSWSTLVLLGYWIIPSAFVGWWMQMKAPRPAGSN